MTAEPAGYGSPGAFRRALTDRLRTIAAETRWALPHLQRQFAYDRLLERLYAVDDGWIVKGAAALLARDLGVRATIDIDVYRERTRELAESELREAAGRDIGDWFRFEIGAGRPVGLSRSRRSTRRGLADERLARVYPGTSTGPTPAGPTRSSATTRPLSEPRSWSRTVPPGRQPATRSVAQLDGCWIPRLFVRTRASA